MGEPTVPLTRRPRTRGRLRRVATRAAFVGLVAVVLGLWTVAMGLGMVRAAPEETTIDAATAPYAQPGPHPVGVRDLPAPGPDATAATLWYPASSETGSRATYQYAIGILDTMDPVALATYPGRARRGAPADSTAGPYPLVVLSPGFALRPGAYGWLAEHLASYGLVVVAPDHDEPLDPSRLWQATIDRPRDLTALIDQLTTQEHTASLIDPERIAALGHSYGGYAAQAVGGARLHTTAFRNGCRTTRRTQAPGVFLCDALEPHLDDMAARAGLTAPPTGLWPDWSDQRVDAVVSLAGDAAPFGPAGLKTLDVPVAAIGGTADQDTPYSSGARLTYRHAGTPRRIELGLVGAEHFVFTGPCDSVRRVLAMGPFGFCSDPAWNRASARDLVAHYVTAFLSSELDRNPSANTVLATSPPSDAAIRYRTHGYPP